MTRTLRFGTHPDRLAAAKARIGRFVTRRRLPTAFEAMRAAEDYARQVALDVSPGQLRTVRATRVEVLDIAQRRRNFLDE